MIIASTYFVLATPRIASIWMVCSTFTPFLTGSHASGAPFLTTSVICSFWSPDSVAFGTPIRGTFRNPRQYRSGHRKQWARVRNSSSALALRMLGHIGLIAGITPIADVVTLDTIHFVMAYELHFLCF